MSPAEADPSKSSEESSAEPSSDESSEEFSQFYVLITALFLAGAVFSYVVGEWVTATMSGLAAVAGALFAAEKWCHDHYGAEDGLTVGLSWAATVAIALAVIGALALLWIEPMME